MNKTIKTLITILSVFFLPIIVIYFSHLFWSWNTFLLNSIFLDTSSWEQESLYLVKGIMFAIGFFTILSSFSFFEENKKHLINN